MSKDFRVLSPTQRVCDVLRGNGLVDLFQNMQESVLDVFGCDPQLGELLGSEKENLTDGRIILSQQIRVDLGVQEIEQLEAHVVEELLILQVLDVLLQHQTMRGRRDHQS